ncbi:hypothetical protein ACLOJK_034509 [Asimina triloba]
MEACHSSLLVASLEAPTGSSLSRAEIFVSRCDGNPSGGGALVRRDVPGSTFGEASSCPSNEEIFSRPFNMEARAMKILGDLLPIELRSIRKNHALGRTPTQDREGLGAGERMLRNYLPNVWKELLELEQRIRLLDGCASREEYRYHMLGKRLQFLVDRPHARD